MKQFIIPALLSISLLLSGCATLFTGTTQRVTIDSTPPGAAIVIDGKYIGTTPAKVRLDRDVNAILDDGKEISLEMDGYASNGYYLGADFEPVSILNMFNVFFWAVDAATGAIMKYDSDYYNFVLMPYDQQVSYMGVAPQQAEEDDYERLMKLVELYEEGMITEEEFEQEKAKIFNKGRQE